MSSWAKTRKLYTNWLTDTGLKCEFAKKIKIDNLSLWWATKLVDRDNINETSWYLNLDKKINGDKIKTKNFYLTLLFLIFKLLKKLLFKIIIIIFIKLFFKKKKIVGKKNLAFIHSSRTSSYLIINLLIINMENSDIKIQKAKSIILI